VADLRKWLRMFSAPALLVSLCASAHAQLTSQFSCAASSANPALVRSEGVTELVGDVLLQCSGGTPTPVGANIPQSNIQIFLNTNLTSRLINTTTNLSEATLLIDEPFPADPSPSTAALPAGAPLSQLACQANNQSNCAIMGTGGGTGNQGPYSGVPGRYNIFQGHQVAGVTNSVAWLGVPIDAPGANGVRTIRITNIRANAFNLTGGNGLIPAIITMFVALNGSEQVLLGNSTFTVGYVQPGLLSTNTTGSYTQCNSVNAASLGSTGGVPAPAISVTATEGFPSSWKVRNWSQIVSQQTFAFITNSSQVTLQNVPGFPYNTESGFVASPGGAAMGFGAISGAVGVPDQGTQLEFDLAGIGAGVNLTVPSVITFTGAYAKRGQAPGYAVLVAGASSAGAVTVNGTTASVTYEVLSAYANITESATLAVTVAYISDTTHNLPAPGTTQVSVNFAPVSSVPAASFSAPIPRFYAPYPLRNLFSINVCACNLLFPFVTNQAGFDTGIAIANTTRDPFGTPLEQGIVTLYYYGAGASGADSPASQQSAPVAAGTELVFTLSGGGDHGITATPDFQGYIISIASFQYCHAFAFISDLGSLKLAEGYLAIQLDTPGLNRTFTTSENEGH